MGIKIINPIKKDSFNKNILKEHIRNILKYFLNNNFEYIFVINFIFCFLYVLFKIIVLKRD